MLNRNPVNYFAEVEQLAFDPSNMPPGVEASPDKMLQVLFFYDVTSNTPRHISQVCLHRLMMHKRCLFTILFLSKALKIWFLVISVL